MKDPPQPKSTTVVVLRAIGAAEHDQDNAHSCILR
jgi:hypothetical protein